MTSSEEAAPHRGYVYAACSAVAVALSYFLGKDMPWDQLHYHFYAGFSALNDRFDADYFAAGPQSYFNPYAYVPFYLLVKLGLPGLAVASVLALIQSVVLWLTYEIACAVAPPASRRERFFFGLCATVLALMNPILLQQIGSSFADITTAALVLGGWLLLVQAIRRPSVGRVICGALLLGIAAALKPTNIVHALAGCLLALFVPLPRWARLRSSLCFGAALGGGFALAAAPWSFRLERAFANPMFPLLNAVFKSPQLTTASLKSYRFVPESLIDALERPFAISGTGSMVHEELCSPDIRYALLLLVALVFLIVQVVRLSRRTTAVGARPDSGGRALAALGCGFAADWVLWLSGSGNGRYFIPMACVAGVLAVALLFRLLARHRTGRNGILLALFLAQGIQLADGAEFRWNRAPWEGHWFNVEIADELARQPSLYLLVGGPSNAFLAPFLPRGSGFVNVSGGFVIGADGVNAARVRAMIERSAPRVRVLVSGRGIFADDRRLEPRQSEIDDILRPFALRVDMSDCATITVSGMRWSTWRGFGSSLPAPSADDKLSRGAHFTTCRLLSAPPEDAQQSAERRAADIVLDHLEDACPSLFRPARSHTEHVNGRWLRRYGATDLTAWIGDGAVNFVDAVRNPRRIALGSAQAWARGPLPLACGRRHGIYFAQLTSPGR